MTGIVGRRRETLAGAVPVAVLGTLVCCALPITFVALGAGSVVASVVSAAPWLGALTRHKVWVFLFSGLLLAVDYWMLYRSGGAACEPGGVCHPSHSVGRWMRRLFWSSVAVYGVAFTAAYLSLPIAQALGF